MLDLNGDADEVNQLAKRKDPRGAARCVLSLGWFKSTVAKAPG